MNISKIVFLLSNKMNLIIRGDRLSGKTTIVEKSLSYFKNTSQFEVVHWSNTSKGFNNNLGNTINKTIGNKVKIYITNNKINKRIRETAAEILLKRDELTNNFKNILPFV